MSEITPLAFEGNEVRMLMMEGEPWWVAADVCRALGIANSRDALSRIKDGQKGVGSTDTLGGAQRVATVNEPGLYRLVFQSRKPNAEAFMDWIAEEVLPSIRKAGMYSLVEPTYADPPPRELAAPESRNDPAPLGNVLEQIVRDGRLYPGRTRSRRQQPRHRAEDEAKLVRQRVDFERVWVQSSAVLADGFVHLVIRTRGSVVATVCEQRGVPTRGGGEGRARCTACTAGLNQIAI